MLRSCLRMLLPGIKQPTLIIHGRKDTIFRTEVGKRLNKLVPSSRLQVIAGENHIIVLYNPLVVACEIVSFCDSL